MIDCLLATALQFAVALPSCPCRPLFDDAIFNLRLTFAIFKLFQIQRITAAKNTNDFTIHHD